MKTVDGLDIAIKDLETIKDLLKRYIPNTEVWVYGSRVKFTAKPSSDLDMVAFIAKEQDSNVYKLKEAFEESSLPFRIDFFIWDEIPAEFHDNIKEIHFVMQQAKEINIPSGWREVKLRDFMLFNPSEKIAKESLVTKVDMDKLQPFTKKISSAIKTNFTSGSKFRNKDTLVARITPCLENGKTAFVDILEENETAFGSTEFIVLREKQEISFNKFIYYFATSPDFRDKAISLMSGTSGRQRIDTNALKEVIFNFPLLSEQERIAGVLGAFDDKIELLREQNKTLEDMAKAIFKSWFVDFDIVKAKQNKEEKAEIISKYKITEEIYNLFPDSFSDSPLGPIPTGWEVSKLKNDFNILMGQSPSGDTYNEKGKGIPFFQGRRDFTFRYPEHRVYCSQPTRLANTGDTLISVRAPVGDLNMASCACCIGRGVASIIHKSKSPTYTYYLIENLKPIFERYNGEGTVFGSINKTDLENIDIISSNKNILHKYIEQFSCLDNKIEENSKQIQTLTKLRDGLLPKLISGTIRV